MCELSLLLLSQGKNSGPPKPHQLRQSDKMEDKETRVSKLSTHVHNTCWSCAHHMLPCAHYLLAMYIKMTKPRIASPPLLLLWSVHFTMHAKNFTGVWFSGVVCLFGHFCEVCLVNHTFSLCISKSIAPMGGCLGASPDEHLVSTDNMHVLLQSH